VDGVEIYTQTEKGCVSNASAAFPHQLVIEGPTAEYSNAPLKTVNVPQKAESNMGGCESELTVTVPYAPRYSMGIPREGHGIASPYAPDEDWIVTRGDAQKVTMVTQSVTTLKSD
jgi:hypothetical protein